MPNFILDETSLPGEKSTGDSLSASEFNIVRQSLLDVQTVMRAGGYSGQISETITHNGTAYAITDASGQVDWSIVASLLAAFSHDTFANAINPGGRLTLTTAVPVTTSDVTGATTIRYTPYKGNRVSIFNGTFWLHYTFSELSNVTTDSSTGKAGPAAVANNSVYDLFVWNDAGTLRLTRGAAWTNDTTRSAAISMQGGRYVNDTAITNGPAQYLGLYVGTVRSGGSATIEDSLAKRWCWNMYNRVERSMRVLEATNTWTWSTASWHQANASALNQLDYVCGLAEDNVEAEVMAAVTNSDSSASFARVGIGIDSTTAIGTGTLAGPIDFTNATYNGGHAHYRGVPGIGRHYLAWLEYGTGSGDTQTWMGDFNAPAAIQHGIVGTVWG